MERKEPGSTPAGLSVDVMLSLINLGVAVANAKPGDEAMLIAPKPHEAATYPAPPPLATD